ncbi:DUF4365 domain-containing protein [Pseudolactococcus reticulitermitis]|uniref:DUF4365 domain-containing protein n=1 Tax=Pseudolactococcus reticulitermitis TaxID=2025039 RepID=A0A224X9T3_9LACT|nr:DUF4365 domain-containing protein [Lactococcus reticulitermitis]GAX46461.1 hypothetical protein RsY01_40 [Lactococcus reticulitermitis]
MENLILSEKSPKRSKPQKTGAIGESLLQARLEEYAIVNRVQSDFGDDCICSLTDSTGKITEKMFFGQAKAHKKIDKTKEEYIQTMETSNLSFWLKRKYITFLFIIDKTTEEIYYIDPTEQIRNNLSKIQTKQTLGIRVPLKNSFKKGEALPPDILKSMSSFDEQLFNGEFVKALEYLNTFSEKDWFSNSKKPEILETAESITISYRNVRLSGFFWTPKSNGFGAYQIIFARFQKLSKSSIQLNHKDILRLFYFGRKTSISFEHEKNHRQYIRIPLPDYHEFHIEFGNTTVYLYENELEELNKVIDVFIEKYVERIMKFSQRYNSIGLKPIGHNPTQIKLMTIEKELWEEMLEFKEEHLIENGDYDKGYKFEKFNNILALASQNNFPHQTLFYVEGNYKLGYNNESVVEVIWNAPEFTEYLKYDEFWYSVSETYNFIIEEIIMKIQGAYRIYRKNIFGDDSLTNDRFYISSCNKDKINIENTKSYFKKEDISKEMFEKLTHYRASSYKLDINNIYTGHEFSNLFYELFEFLKARGVLGVDIPNIELFIRTLIKKINIIFLDDKIYAIYSEKEYYQERFEDYKNTLEKLLERFPLQVSDEEKSSTYLELFKEVSDMLGDFGNYIDFVELKSYLPNFSEIISIYNEEKLISLLI